ncbi:MAG: presqualene diphosphate synthase HpnD [Nannocystaceae bacterium]|nr:presqualene diphosphate synthase HpnD [Nannocystaceae bacterium]
MDRLGPLAQSLPRRGVKLLRRLTKRSSSNFAFAFLFLGQEQRDALKQVYEFCRVVDDIVDERPPGPEGEAAARAGLAAWREEVARIFDAGDGAPQTPLGRALHQSRAHFDYPRHGFDEIIAGCEMDLERTRYADTNELRLYCYRVASCVGLLCIAIFGDTSPAAQRYAEHLGLALQLTNILRDVGEDALRGRVYLPLSLLAQHGLCDADILAQRYDARFVAFAAEFAELAETEYRKAWEALQGADLRALVPAEVMGRTYHRILVEIRDRDFNVYTRRAALRRRDKLKVAALAIARAGFGLRTTH